MKPIFVTAHARNRFKLRFGHRFHKDVLNGKYLNEFIKDKYLEATPSDFALRMVPGKYNMMCIKHGNPIRLSSRGDMTFAWFDEGGRVVITTVYRE